VTRRQKAIAFFVALCVLLVAAAISLNIGWIIANAGRITPIILGIVLFGLIIAGLIVYTVFLVLEIRRNEEHDSFINSVTHELKTPIASIKLYLETLQSRPVPEARRQEFYDIMLADAARLRYELPRQKVPDGATSRRLDAPAAKTRGARTVTISMEQRDGRPVVLFMDTPAAVPSVIDPARITIGR